ncbi:MAG: HAMP domain-containing histidine kinase [Bifidobacteriaceae bacterium]|jgi:signal transduction histidine kinase|nr:HAMP domain-containing histidine kinase [Bifidobacteriaceae bacterium]
MDDADRPPPSPASSTGDARAEEPIRPNRPSRWAVLAGFAWFWVAQLIGWLGVKALFGWTGRPPEPLDYMLQVLIGLLVAFLGAQVLWRIGGDRTNTGRSVLDALEQISQGDFDVRIEDPGRGPFSEMIDSVNRMARELGTVEQQRQDFISNVSHEIQSPLTSIQGFAALLREPGLDADTQQHYLDIITAECRRLSALSANMLRLSALDDAKIEGQPFRLDEQLREVILTLEPQWSVKGVEVELEAPASVQVTGEPELLHQVWVNLAHNAIKFSPANGRISVRLTPEPAGTPGERAGWRIEVEDHGDGIGQSDLPHVFERFYRADKARAVGGNGLGLALAKRIVDLHGGRIWAASKPGEGSTFTVRLP